MHAACTFHCLHPELKLVSVVHCTISFTENSLSHAHTLFPYHSNAHTLSHAHTHSLTHLFSYLWNCLIIIICMACNWLTRLKKIFGSIFWTRSWLDILHLEADPIKLLIFANEDFFDSAVKICSFIDKDFFLHVTNTQT